MTLLARSTDPTDSSPRRGSGSARKTTAPRASSRGAAHERKQDDAAAARSSRAGIGGLLRGGTGAVLGGIGGISGVDAAARSIDRLSRTAERGVDFLERLEAELGWDRAIELVDNLEAVVALLHGISDSMGEIEAMVTDLHAHLLPEPRKASNRRR